MNAVNRFFVSTSLSRPRPERFRATSATLLAAVLLSLPACLGTSRSGPDNGTLDLAGHAPARAEEDSKLGATLHPVDMSLQFNPAVTFDTAWAIIARTHWDTTYNGVNWNAVRDSLRPLAVAATSDAELRDVLTRMVATLGQSHFSIIPREVSDVVTGSGQRSENAMRFDRSGTVGITLRFLEGRMVVLWVDPASSAARAGIRPGWSLESVDGRAVAPALARIPGNMDSRRSALLAYSIGTAALAGLIGQPVSLTLLAMGDKQVDVTVLREAPQGVPAKFGNLPPIPAHLEFERRESGARVVGIIRFNIWMPILAAQFDAAIDSLRGSDAIVLDLRGNFGGVGGMSMGFAGHFLDSTRVIGTMVQRNQGPMRFVANPRRVDTQARSVKPFSGPLAIVVDELSVSTTEIFAGGLQAMNRARVFGVQTAGQALPSIPERLPNGDILYHAIANFKSPTGKDIEGDGVIPDERVPLDRNALLSGKDPALDAAVRWAAAGAQPKPKKR